MLELHSISSTEVQEWSFICEVNAESYDLCLSLHQNVKADIPAM